MRRKLLEALTYPRLRVLESIDLEDCPHDGSFQSPCDRCHDCDLKQECHWLSCLNDFAAFATKPTYTIHASLVYSLKLVEANNEHLQHDLASCACESCSWIRDAHQLTREFQSMTLEYNRELSTVSAV